MSIRTAVKGHLDSLPVLQRANGSVSNLPADAFYFVPPVVAGVFIGTVHPTMGSDALAALLAGAGVLGGLLVQVLASVAGRIGSLADSISARSATEVEKTRLKRLRRAKDSLAYATFLSLGLVLMLSSAAMLASVPTWFAFGLLTVFLHWLATLALVVSRVSRIGDLDEDDMMSAGARHRDASHPES